MPPPLMPVPTVPKVSKKECHYILLKSLFANFFEGFIVQCFFSDTCLNFDAKSGWVPRVSEKKCQHMFEFWRQNHRLDVGRSIFTNEHSFGNIVVSKNVHQ
jgi:hypothetical protein